MTPSPAGLTTQKRAARFNTSRAARYATRPTVKPRRFRPTPRCSAAAHRRVDEIRISIAIAPWPTARSRCCAYDSTGKPAAPKYLAATIATLGDHHQEERQMKSRHMSMSQTDLFRAITVELKAPGPEASCTHRADASTGKGLRKPQRRHHGHAPLHVQDRRRHRRAATPKPLQGRERDVGQSTSTATSTGDHDHENVPLPDGYAEGLRLKAAAARRNAR